MPSNGYLYIAAADGRGQVNLAYPFTTDDFPAGWTHVVAVRYGLGGARDGALLYNAASGRTELYTVGSDGRFTHLASASWRSGWTHLVAGTFGFGSGPHGWVFCYDSHDGTGEFWSLAPAGQTRREAEVSVGAGWTHVVAGEFGGEPKRQSPGTPLTALGLSGARAFTDLAFYNASSGHIEFHLVGRSGHVPRSAGDGAGFAGLSPLVEHRRRGHWAIGLTQLVSGRFGGDGWDDLLGYDAATGHTVLASTDGGGRLHALGTADRPGWTRVLPGKFTDSPWTSLFWYSDSGDAEYTTTDGAGRLTSLQRYPSSASPFSHDAKAAAVGSFAGDSFSDVLFYNEYTIAEAPAPSPGPAPQPTKPGPTPSPAPTVDTSPGSFQGSYIRDVLGTEAASIQLMLTGQHVAGTGPAGGMGREVFSEPHSGLIGPGPASVFPFTITNLRRGSWTITAASDLSPPLTCQVSTPPGLVTFRFGSNGGSCG